MTDLKSTNGFTSAGVAAAIAASLCCLTPVIALFAGSSSIAANLAWLAPARPYLIGLCVVVLSVAWYLKLKQTGAADIDCNCETGKKATFIQSKKFLGIVTCFAVVMLTFPLYAKMFYPPSGTPVNPIKFGKQQEVRFAVQGMTCAACENHVNSELAKVAGVVTYKTSFDSRSSLVSFDESKVGVSQIVAAINKTGYKVTGHKTIAPRVSSKKDKR